MLDYVLGILLLLVIPVLQVWRSRPSSGTPKSKGPRYLKSIMMIAGLLAILTFDWIVSGRTMQELGLGFPRQAPALVGLGLAVFLLAVLAAASLRKPSAGRADMDKARRELFPDTPDETRLFLLFAVTVGLGWEVLYRGFLVPFLQSYTGVVPAIMVAALAYALGHGVKSWGQFVRSLIAALAFTIGYAVTANIWWLILLHIGLPMLGLLASRVEREGA